jgi:hypothetical protein
MRQLSLKVHERSDRVYKVHLDLHDCDYCSKRSFPVSPSDLPLLCGRTPGGLVPWSGVTHRASSRAVAAAAQVGGEVRRVNVLRELGLVTRSENVDLSDGGLVQPWLDERPHRREEVWGLWVTVSL